MSETQSSSGRKAELEEMAESLRGIWWHSIDLGEGVVTPGTKTPEYLARELNALQLPDLRGKSVLDIGAWDGFFSFSAERLGAERVVALDHYVWSMDFTEKARYDAECQSRGEIPKPYEFNPNVWHPDSLPGKRGFDTAHKALNSKVESIVTDFMTTDLDALGTFDVVIYMGVLYHMENPMEALRRVAKVTNELMILETEAIIVPGYEHVKLVEFFEADELNHDPTNWWSPNLAALVGMCRAAGFSRVDTDVDHNAHNSLKRTVRKFLRPEPQDNVQRYRTFVRCWK